MPNYVSAADFANSPEQKAKEQKAFAYQAANPSTSSYMPQANDPGSAAYRPPTATPNMSAANANERSAMDSFRANPGSALSQMQNLAGTYAERMKSGDTAGAKTVQDYANSISKVAGVTPQSFSFSGITAPQAYNPNVNYSSDTPMPQNNAVSTPGIVSAAALGGNNNMDPGFSKGMDTLKNWNKDPGFSNGMNALKDWNKDPGFGVPTMAAGSQQGTVKDAQGKIIGSYLPGGGFAPATGQGSQQMSVTTPMAYSPNMGIGAFEQSQFGMPQMSNGTGATGTRINELTPQQKADIKTQLDARIARQTTLANSTKAGFQTAYDRLAATTKDDRVLQDSSFQRNNAPESISGATGYRASMMDRERERTDREGQQDLQTRLANVDLTLADYVNATDAERVKMEADVLKAERDYGVQQDQLGLQRQGQALGQFNADRSFNYGVSRDNVGDSRYADTTNYNRSRDSLTDSRYTDTTSYNRGQDQITNNRNAANDALTLRKQHIDEANYYSDKYGIPVQPKDDFQLVLDQVAGKQTVAQQTASQKAEETKRSEAWKRVEFGGSVQTQADADLLGIPLGTLSQKAKEFAMDSAFKNRSANTSDYNAQTSRFTAEQNAANVAFDNKLAASKYELDQLKTGEEKDAAIAKLLDSSPLLQKSYDSRGNVVGNKVADADKKQMEQYIANLGLPAAEAKKWFIRYGLWSDSGN